MAKVPRANDLKELPHRANANVGDAAIVGDGHVEPRGGERTNNNLITSNSLLTARITYITFPSEDALFLVTRAAKLHDASCNHFSNLWHFIAGTVVRDEFLLICKKPSALDRLLIER